MNLRVGTSGYSYPEWKGTFYPEKFPAAGMLRYYAERFGTVEINNTFYRMPTTAQLEKWAAEVPEGFAFVLKMSQKITHIARLRSIEDMAGYFFSTTVVLGPRLGPVLVQLPPNFKKDLERLRSFLALVPTGHRVAFEFRNPSWYDEDVFAEMRSRNASLCLAEADEEYDPPFVSTADWGYLRLRRPDYDDAMLNAWIERVKSQPWEDAFVFFKHEDKGMGPMFATRFIALAG